MEALLYNVRLRIGRGVARILVEDAEVVIRGRGIKRAWIELGAEEGLVVKTSNIREGEHKVMPPIDTSIRDRDGCMEVIVHSDGAPLLVVEHAEEVIVHDRGCRLVEKNRSVGDRIQCRYILVDAKKYQLEENTIRVHDGFITTVGLEDIRPLDNKLLEQYIKDITAVAMQHKIPPEDIGSLLWTLLSNNNQWILMNKQTRECIIHVYRNHNPYKVLEHTKTIGCNKVYAGGSTWRGTARIIAEALNELLRKPRYTYLDFFMALTPPNAEKITELIEQKYKLILLPPPDMR